MLPNEVWVEDRSWRVLPAGHSRRCRMASCRAPAVAELWRAGRRAGSWWAYCPDHLYGRRIEGGLVLLGVHPESPAAARGWTHITAMSPATVPSGPLAAFLGPIRQGALVDVGVLADWLDEQGDLRGERLRKRWRKWQAGVEAVREEERRKAAELAAPLEKVQGAVQAHGGSMSWGVVYSIDTSHLDTALRRYVLRLFPECRG